MESRSTNGRQLPGWLADSDSAASASTLRRRTSPAPKRPKLETRNKKKSTSPQPGPSGLNIFELAKNSKKTPRSTAKNTASDGKRDTKSNTTKKSDNITRRVKTKPVNTIAKTPVAETATRVSLPIPKMDIVAVNRSNNSSVVKSVHRNQEKEISDFAIQKYIENSNIKARLLADMVKHNKQCSESNIKRYCITIIQKYIYRSLISYKGLLNDVKYISLSKELEVKELLAKPYITNESLLLQHNNMLEAYSIKKVCVNLSVNNIAYNLEKKIVRKMKKSDPKEWYLKTYQMPDVLLRTYNKKNSLDYIKKYSNVMEVISPKGQDKNAIETALQDFMLLDRHGSLWKKLKFSGEPNYELRKQNVPSRISVPIPTNKKSISELTFEEYMANTNIREILASMVHFVEEENTEPIFRRNYENYINNPEKRNSGIYARLKFKNALSEIGTRPPISISNETEDNLPLAELFMSSKKDASKSNSAVFKPVTIDKQKEAIPFVSIPQHKDEKNNEDNLISILIANTNIEHIVKNNLQTNVDITKNLFPLPVKVRNYFRQNIKDRKTYPKFLLFKNGWTARKFTEYQKNLQGSLSIPNNSMNEPIIEPADAQKVVKISSDEAGVQKVVEISSDEDSPQNLIENMCGEKRNKRKSKSLEDSSEKDTSKNNSNSKNAKQISEPNNNKILIKSLENNGSSNATNSLNSDNHISATAKSPVQTSLVVDPIENDLNTIHGYSSTYACESKDKTNSSKSNLCIKSELNFSGSSITTVRPNKDTHQQKNKPFDNIPIHRDEKVKQKYLLHIIIENTNVEAIIKKSFQSLYPDKDIDKDMMKRKAKLYFRQYIQDKQTYSPYLIFKNGWTASKFKELVAQLNGSLDIPNNDLSHSLIIVPAAEEQVVEISSDEDSPQNLIEDMSGDKNNSRIKHAKEVTQTINSEVLNKSLENNCRLTTPNALISTNSNNNILASSESPVQSPLVVDPIESNLNIIHNTCTTTSDINSMEPPIGSEDLQKLLYNEYIISSSFNKSHNINNREFDESFLMSPLQEDFQPDFIVTSTQMNDPFDIPLIEKEKPGNNNQGPIIESNIVIENPQADIVSADVISNANIKIESQTCGSYSEDIQFVANNTEIYEVIDSDSEISNLEEINAGDTFLLNMERGLLEEKRDEILRHETIESSPPINAVENNLNIHSNETGSPSNNGNINNLIDPITTALSQLLNSNNSVFLSSQIIDGISQEIRKLSGNHRISDKSVDELVKEKSKTTDANRIHFKLKNNFMASNCVDFIYMNFLKIRNVEYNRSANLSFNLSVFFYNCSGLFEARFVNEHIKELLNLSSCQWLALRRILHYLNKYEYTFKDKDDIRNNLLQRLLYYFFKTTPKVVNVNVVLDQYSDYVSYCSRKSIMHKENYVDIVNAIDPAIKWRMINEKRKLTEKM